MPEIVSLSSDGPVTYLGSLTELGMLDQASRTYTPLVAGTIELQAYGLGTVDHPSHAIRAGDWLYFDSWGYRIQRLFLGQDGKGTVERLVQPSELQTPGCQLGGDFAVAGGQAYWLANDGTSSQLLRRPLAGGPTRLVAGGLGDSRLTPAATRIYMLTEEPGRGPTVRAVELATGEVASVRRGEPTAPGTPLDLALPRAANASRFYWMEGTTLQAVPHDSSTATPLASGLPPIRQLTADEGAVYALQTGTGQDAILRIDAASGAIATVVTRSSIEGILAYRGKIWFVSGLPLALESLDSSGGGATVAFSGADPAVVYGTRLFGVDGRIAAGGTAWVLLHDPAAATSTLFTPQAGASMLASDDRSLYVASWGDGIQRIPVDVPLRTPEVLRADVVTVEKLFLDQGWLYWSEWSGFYGIYRICRMQTDGTGYQVLLDGDHRQLALHGGRLYFLCEATCGLSRWTLVSMDPSGGATTAEVPLGLWPQDLVVGDGTFYVADTADGLSFGVWAIDPVARRSVQVVRDLPSYGIDLDASAQWIYVRVNQGFLGTLTRYPVGGWGQVGGPQVVDTEVEAFRAGGGSLLYWRYGEGLKRQPE